MPTHLTDIALDDEARPSRDTSLDDVGSRQTRNEALDDGVRRTCDTRRVRISPLAVRLLADSTDRIPT